MFSNCDALKQNLIDTGCDEQLIQQLMSLQAERKTAEMLSILAGQRKRLLDSVHAEERKIKNSLKMDYFRQKTGKNR